MINTARIWTRLHVYMYVPSGHWSVFGRHQFFSTSEHYGKAHGSLLSGWMNYNYTACYWFPTSSNILIHPDHSSDKSGLNVTDCTVQSAEYWCSLVRAYCTTWEDYTFQHVHVTTSARMSGMCNFDFHSWYLISLHWKPKLFSFYSTVHVVYKLSLHYHVNMATLGAFPHTKKARFESRFKSRLFLRVSTQAENSAIWIATIFYACPHTGRKIATQIAPVRASCACVLFVNRQRTQTAERRLAWWDIKNRYDFHSPFSHTSHRK